MQDLHNLGHFGSKSQMRHDEVFRVVFILHPVLEDLW
jgi:hypothetical protein